MNKKELKETIKEMVRQSLVEIFAEIHLENIVENVVKESFQKQIKKTTNFVQQQPIKKQQYVRDDIYQNKTQLRESMMKNLGVSDNEWQSIYSDIDPDKVPSHMEGPTNPEFTTEDDLKKLGLL